MSQPPNRTQSTFAKDRDDEDSVKAVAVLFDKQAERYERLLPSHIKLEDFRNAFLTAVQRRPALLQADRNSFWLALQQCAADGLKADNREAALVIFADDEEDEAGNKTPSKSSKPKQVVYMPMVAGLRKLLRNTGQISTIETELVFRGETIKIWREDGIRHFTHEVNTSPDADRSAAAIIGAYAVVVFKDGTWQPEWMSRSDIERVRAVSRAKSRHAPWQTWYDEMARKTVLRRLAKQLDRSPEIATLQDALEKDPTAAETIDGEATEIVDSVASFPTAQNTTRTAPATTRTTTTTVTAAATVTDAATPGADDPNAWRRDVTGKQAASKSDTTTSKPADQKPKEESKTEPSGATDEGAADDSFSAWLVDADGVEVRADPYTDPVEFAHAFAQLAKMQGLIDDLLSLNPATKDAVDASDEAAKIIEDAIQGNSYPARTTPPTEKPYVATVLALPLLPGKKTPHWPNYIDLACKELDATPDADAATAWYEANKATFMLKNMAAEKRIGEHYRVVMQRHIAARQGAGEAEPTSIEAINQPEYDDDPADNTNAEVQRIIAGLQNCADRQQAALYKERVRPDINRLRATKGGEEAANYVIRTIDGWNPSKA